jgi:hypothetical protein
MQISNRFLDVQGRTWDYHLEIPAVDTGVKCYGSIIFADGTSAQLGPLSGQSSPGIPGSGSNFWIIQCSAADVTTTTSNKSSASDYPTPDAGYIELARQSIPSTAAANPQTWPGFAFPSNGAG